MVLLVCDNTCNLLHKRKMFQSILTTTDNTVTWLILYIWSNVSNHNLCLCLYSINNIIPMGSPNEDRRRGVHTYMYVLQHQHLSIFPVSFCSLLQYHGKSFSNYYNMSWMFDTITCLITYNQCITNYLYQITYIFSYTDSSTK